MIHRARSNVLQGYFRIESMRRPGLGGPPGLAGAPPGAWPGMRSPRGVLQARSHGDVITTPLPTGQLRLIGEGKPLEPGLRRTMEQFFASDFSAVRVHQGPAATALGALAFTLGDTLYFAPGMYNPTTREGIELLGHELTHVVQQRDGRVANPQGSGIAIVQDPALEAEADRMGRELAGRLAPKPRIGQPALATRPPALQLARAAAPGAATIAKIASRPATPAAAARSRGYALPPMRSNRGLLGAMALQLMNFPRYQSEQEAEGQEIYYGLGSHIESEFKSCRMCRGKLEHKGIPESQLGTTFLNYIYGIMVDNDKLGEKDTTKMVGVMKTDQGWFAANSGKNNELLGRFVTSYWRIEELTRSSQLTWIESSAMTKYTAKTAGGASIPSHYVEDCQYQNLPLACAAPKLITHAIKHGLQIYEMSEVWFGVSKAGGMSVWSCKTCQPLLLMLLCPSSK